MAATRVEPRSGSSKPAAGTGPASWGVAAGAGGLAAAVFVDTRVVPGSDGTLTFATGGALGTALALWTSNVVHPTVSNLIGAIIFGGPIGLGLGALLWAIARRTLGHAPGR